MTQKNSPAKGAQNSKLIENNITIGIVRNARDPRVATPSMTWGEFCSSLSLPLVRAEKDGTGFVLARFSTPHRAGKNVMAVSALGFDVDGKSHAPMPPAEAHGWLLEKGWMHAIYSTWSHTPAEPRYRIVIALDAPMDPRALRDAQEAILGHLPEGIAGAVDGACLGDVARLFYAPATPADRADHFEFYAGGVKPLRAANLMMMAAAAQAVREQEQAQRKAMKPRYTGRPGASVIEQFNNHYSVSDVLAGSGYVKKRGRWVSPNSHTGTAGIVILDGRVYCHHDGDALHNGHALDAFDAYALIHHNGDLKAAAAAIRGVPHG